jgi:branched-subunit amino acid aminotransferase/4-amino-4-deoxychorismate lyase
MLDVDGFVSETNATNVFLVRRGELSTPVADSCLPGVTRATVLELARGAAIPTHERRITLSEVYAADEMFTTGTMGELVAVVECDRRAIGQGVPGPLTQRLTALFAELTRRDGTPLPR